MLDGMRALRLTLWLAIMVPAWALIGAFSAIEAALAPGSDLPTVAWWGLSSAWSLAVACPASWPTCALDDRGDAIHEGEHPCTMTIANISWMNCRHCAVLKSLPPFDPTTPPEPSGNPEKDRLRLEAWGLACRLLRLMHRLPTLPDNLACVLLAQVDQISARTEEIDRELKAISDE
jgi:hypothetical protein